MTRRIILIIISALVLILMFLIVRAVMQPRPFQWEPTYSSYDKQPYGAEIIFEQLENIFPGQKIKRFGKKDFNYYYWYIEDNFEYYDEDGEIVNDSSLLLYDMEYDLSETQGFNVLMINDHYYCDDLNARALLLHTFQGNEVFIASNTISEELSKYIGVETAFDSIPSDQQYSDGFTLSIHDELPIQLRSYAYYSYIASFPDSAEVIATNKRDQIIGIKLKIGEGYLTYFSNPLVFTNYYLLKQNNAIAEKLLLALPNTTTYWGNSIRGQYEHTESRSLLSYIHSQESLTWAFYTIIFSVLFLFLFQVKRTQRTIPVVNKPENDSLRFVEVISNLYLLNKNNKEIVKKKMTYFLEMIRSKYHLNTSVIDEPFFKQLSEKSKVDIKIIKTIFKDYDILINQDDIPNPELLHFNRKIQHFKHRK